MSEEEAYQKYKAIRWSENHGEPVCPACGSIAYTEIKTRRTFKCKGCHSQFSVTSKTIFASRKLSFHTILLAIAFFVQGVKGHSALQMSRDINVQYKTAFVLLHKIREALGAAQDISDLHGHVEIDGAYFGGYVKPANHKKNRRDRRFRGNMSGKRQVMVVMREVGGRTTLKVYGKEGDSVSDITKMVARGSTVHADEASHWDLLHGRFDVARINHKESYSTAQACTNWAESFHSRTRRAEIGIHHHIAGPYLRAYGLEMAWREDNRRKSNGQQFDMVLHAVTHYPVSTIWKGYWQRHKKERGG